MEIQNLTMRISMIFFIRLTNALSKKADNLKVAVVLHVAHYTERSGLHQQQKQGVIKECPLIVDFVALAN